MIGSRSHKLHTETSDFDHRGVFVVNTDDYFTIGMKVKGNDWVEGEVDNTSWELQKFLLMATKCNPTILEVFKGPIIESTQEGKEMLKLFPHVWNSNDVKNAFLGYSTNQQKKFLQKKDNKPHKFLVAYLRVLWQGQQLLSTGDFTLDATEFEHYELLKEWKLGKFDTAKALAICLEWEDKLKEAFEKNPDKQTNLEPVNKFIIKIRKKHWK